MSAGPPPANAADAALGALAGAPIAAPPLGAALEAELAALPPARPRRPARQLAALLALGLGWAGALLALLTVRGDATELPVAWLVGGAVAWLVGFVAPCALIAVPARGAVMPRWRAAAVVAAIAAVALVALGLLVHPAGPSSLSYGWDRFARGHTCLELGLLTAVLPVVATLRLLRGALPVATGWTAAALGAAGGSLGGLMLHLHCRVADGLHVGLIHGGAPVVAALLGAVVGRRAT
jgi:hypothetical protein